MSARDQTYPIAILEDRYQGTYSGGKWIALNRAHALENGAYRIIRILDGDAFGDDNDAQDFWSSTPDWVAVGDTPNQALEALLIKLGNGARADI